MADKPRARGLFAALAALVAAPLAISAAPNGPTERLYAVIASSATPPSQKALLEEVIQRQESRRRGVPGSTPVGLPLADSPASLVAVSTSGLQGAYAFPNPAYGGVVTLRLRADALSSVSVSVYDSSGALVHESSDFTQNPAFPANSGKTPQFVYDHSWRASGVATGVYRYKFIGRQLWKPDLIKIGTLAMIK